MAELMRSTSNRVVYARSIDEQASGAGPGRAWTPIQCRITCILLIPLFLGMAACTRTDIGPLVQTVPMPILSIEPGEATVYPDAINLTMELRSTSAWNMACRWLLMGFTGT